MSSQSVPQPHATRANGTCEDWCHECHRLRDTGQEPRSVTPELMGQIAELADLEADTGAALGVTPRFVWLEVRARELACGIMRYVDAERWTPVPGWVAELDKLVTEILAEREREAGQC